MTHTQRHVSAITTRELEVAARLRLDQGLGPAETGRDRRKWSRAMVAVQARICGGVGSFQNFEEIVTCIDISRSGIRVATDRPGYFTDQSVQVTCPFWNHPTAINVSRNAKVIRTAITSDLRYEIGLEFLTGVVLISGAERSVCTVAGRILVLVVESDRGSRIALQQFLETDGYEVMAVERSSDALEILQSETPHVIVADAEAQGGEVSGNALCAVVKASPQLRHIPVILVTASGKPADYASSHLMGAIVCLAKPYRLEQVRQAVRLVAAPPAVPSAYGSTFNSGSLVRTS
jgi:two-component system, chemotaxis family, response regulator PixH